MMGEVGRRLLVALGQSDPGLDAEKPRLLRQPRAIAALGMGDAAPGGHPIHIARPDRLHIAEAVAMDDLAGEEIGHGGEPDMRVRPHVEAVPALEQRRSHCVEEDEGPDHAAVDERQHAAHLEAVTEVAGARDDRHLDRIG